MATILPFPAPRKLPGGLSARTIECFEAVRDLDRTYCHATGDERARLWFAKRDAQRRLGESARAAAAASRGGGRR